MIVYSKKEGKLVYYCEFDGKTIKFIRKTNSKIDAECIIYQNELIINNYYSDHFYTYNLRPNNKENVLLGEKINYVLDEHNKEANKLNLQIETTTIYNNPKLLETTEMTEWLIDLMEPSLIFEAHLIYLNEVVKFIESEYIKNLIIKGKNRQISTMVSCLANSSLEKDNKKMSKTFKNRH